MRVALCGIGRAGSEVARALTDQPDMRLVAALCKPDSGRAGKDVGELTGMPFTGVTAREISEIEDVFSEYKIDVVIDFSSPEASRILLDACRKHGIPAVVCTTGFSDAEFRWMKKIAGEKSFGMVYAPNVTAGVNVLTEMAKIAAQRLPDYDFEVTEIHFKKKKDSPSATAKRIAHALEVELGKTSVPINAIRAGGYIGHHEVLIVGEYEKVHIIHESFSRRAFAEGAIRAAKFVISKKGWYEMQHVLDASMCEEFDEVAE
jgi:4-hydroxy-tetrahydrodipicolinate reductase